MAPYIFDAARKHIEETINFHFTNDDFLQEALHTKGPYIIGGRSVDQNNTKMAMVGNSVHNLVLNLDSWERNIAKGTADIRRSSTATNANLGKVGREKRLHYHLHLNDGHSAEGVSDGMLATALEAVIGAVFIDSKDMQTVKDVVKVLGLL